jgi:hypothetical protein
MARLRDQVEDSKRFITALKDYPIATRLLARSSPWLTYDHPLPERLHLRCQGNDCFIAN